MAGLSGLDGNFRRFQVTDFADYDDIRVLTEKGFECDWKCQSLAVVDIDLVDTVQRNFCRVFGCRNIDSRFIENIQTGVQRDGFPGTRRTGNQHHTVGTLNGIKQKGFLVRFIALLAVFSRSLDG